MRFDGVVCGEEQEDMAKYFGGKAGNVGHRVNLETEVDQFALNLLVEDLIEPRPPAFFAEVIPPLLM
jgi:hypothetical protein